MSCRRCRSSCLHTAAAACRGRQQQRGQPGQRMGCDWRTLGGRKTTSAARGCGVYGRGVYGRGVRIRTCPMRSGRLHRLSADGIRNAPSTEQRGHGRAASMQACMTRECVRACMQRTRLLCQLRRWWPRRRRCRPPASNSRRWWVLCQHRCPLGTGVSSKVVVVDIRHDLCRPPVARCRPPCHPRTGQSRSFRGASVGGRPAGRPLRRRWATHRDHQCRLRYMCNEAVRFVNHRKNIAVESGSVLKGRYKIVKGRSHGVEARSSRHT